MTGHITHSCWDPPSLSFSLVPLSSFDVKAASFPAAVGPIRASVIGVSLFQASPRSPTCGSTRRSTTDRSGRRAAGLAAASVGPGLEGCYSASCVASSARRPLSCRVTWAPTPNKATPTLTRPARRPRDPPAWRSPCPAPAQWDCWLLTAPVLPPSLTASTLGGAAGVGWGGARDGG